MSLNKPSLIEEDFVLRSNILGIIRRKGKKMKIKNQGLDEVFSGKREKNLS
jgi:hypothetical protein